MTGAGKDAKIAERSLVSIAMLKVKYDQKSQDYLDYLRPYVTHVLPGQGERVQADIVAGNVLTEFALRVPVQVIERLLSRFKREGQIRKVDGAFYVEKLSRDADLEHRRSMAEQQISDVLESFKAYCLGKFDNKISNDEAILSLTGFVGKFAVDCLRSFIYASPLPEIKRDEKHEIWAASFINSSAEKQGADWARIKTLFQCVLLANAFTCPDADLATTKFRELSFFLDTPIIISALGLHGEYEKRKADELFRQIKALDGSVFALEHSIEETRSVLKYLEMHIADQSSTNRSIRYARQVGYRPSDIVMFSAEIEERLKIVGIRVRDTPPYDQRHQIDETALEVVLDEAMGQANHKARLHDINSVRSIFVLRAGAKPTRLEQAKAVFITDNWRLATTVDEFSRKTEFSREVSPVITDSSLANICWLKQPAAAQELANLELLAASIAALRPSENEWQACLAECERLKAKGTITDDQEILVRESLIAQEDLITLTKGAGEHFGPEIALELIKRAEERVADPYRREMERSDARVAAVLNELDQEREASHRATDLRRNRAKRWSRVIARVVTHGFFFCILVALYFGWVAANEGLAKIPLWQQGLAIVVPGILTLAGWFGLTRSQVMQGIATKIEAWLKRLFFVD